MTEKQIAVKLTLQDQMSKKIMKAQGRMKKFTKSMTVDFVALAAKVYLFKQALSFFSEFMAPSIEFESAFAGVKKTVNATEKEFNQLSKALIDMSRRIPVAATKLASIQEIAGQLGVKGVKNLTKFTESIAKIVVSTNLTQESAAISFARIASIIGEPIGNIEKMGSAVVELGNNFEVQEDEILTFAQRIAAMGKLSKLTTADIFGVSAAFASVGIQAEAGGTAVNKVLLELSKQGKTGSKALVDFVNELEAAGDKAAQKLEELGFSEARTQRAFLSLAGAGGKLEKALALSNDEMERGTALQIEAAKRFETTASKIQLMKNNIAVLSKNIGDNLLPVFERLLILTKQYVDFATGTDLQLTKLQTLEAAYSKVTEKIEQRNSALFANKRFFNKEFNRQTEMMIRQKGVLEDLITKEKERREEFVLLVKAKKDAINNSSGSGNEDSGNESSSQQREIDDYLIKETNKIEQLRMMWKAWNQEKSAQQLIANQQEVEKLNFKLDVQKKAHKSLWSIAGKARDTFASGISNIFGQMVDGTLNAKKAFATLGKQMLKVLIDFGVQKGINFLLSKIFLKGEVAAAVVSAAAVAAAWAPAAAAVSLATLGSNSIPASAGITATHAISRTLSKIPGAEKGGNIIKSGSVLVGERGPEILNLSKGAQVVPLSPGEKGSSGGVYIDSITIIVERGPNEDDDRDLGEKVAYDLDSALLRARSNV